MTESKDKTVGSWIEWQILDKEFRTNFRFVADELIVSPGVPTCTQL
jgi:hypothetical protein